MKITNDVLTVTDIFTKYLFAITLRKKSGISISLLEGRIPEKL